MDEEDRRPIGGTEIAAQPIELAIRYEPGDAGVGVSQVRSVLGELHVENDEVVRSDVEAVVRRVDPEDRSVLLLVEVVDVVVPDHVISRAVEPGVQTIGPRQEVGNPGRVTRIGSEDDPPVDEVAELNREVRSPRVHCVDEGREPLLRVRHPLPLERRVGVVGVDVGDQAEPNGFVSGSCGGDGNSRNESSDRDPSESESAHDRPLGEPPSTATRSSPAGRTLRSESSAPPGRASLARRLAAWARCDRPSHRT